MITERDAGIFRAALSGVTYAELGARHGVSRERIRQIIESTRRAVARLCPGAPPPPCGVVELRENTGKWLYLLSEAIQRERDALAAQNPEIGPGSWVRSGHLRGKVMTVRGGMVILSTYTPLALWRGSYCGEWNGKRVAVPVDSCEVICKPAHIEGRQTSRR